VDARQPNSASPVDASTPPPLTVQVVSGSDTRLDANQARWVTYLRQRQERSLSRHPGWLTVLATGLKHSPYCIEASIGERLVGLLPLSYVRSLLFGKFLVGLPYLNTGGVLADSAEAATALIDAAVGLAEQLNVQHLELRHEQPVEHPALGTTITSKVHMRLSLPGSAEELWKTFKPKVRNQIRKADKQDFSVVWGGSDLLREFYHVFAVNMRDLGTPVFSRNLFEAILSYFPEDAELCVVRLEKQPVAAAILIHGPGLTEVPSASSLREFNWTNANMLMYWHLLQRAVDRGQQVFDFGRSSAESSTYRFKKQWGAEPAGAVWQYHVRNGSPGDMRREAGKYDRFISLWQKLPVSLTRVIGPPIVRGIP